MGEKILIMKQENIIQMINNQNSFLIDSIKTKYTLTVLNL